MYGVLLLEILDYSLIQSLNKYEFDYNFFFSVGECSHPEVVD